MTDHNRNVRDVGWTLSHRGQFRAACLAKDRGDLAALRESFANVYSTKNLAESEYAKFVAREAGGIAEFLAS